MSSQVALVSDAIDTFAELSSLSTPLDVILFVGCSLHVRTLARL